MSTENKLLPAPAPANNPPYMTVMDEAGYYFGGSDDGLKEDLRKIDGVPNAAYVVKNRRIFVFDKLIALVKNTYGVLNDAKELSPDAVLSLMPNAWVSPTAAVQEFGIVPEPYKLELDKLTGVWIIRHQPFNARIPGVFHSEDAAKKVLENLLVGDIHVGEGDFSYRGQSMVLCERIDVALLPERPVIASDLEPASFVNSNLSRIEFEEGFSLVSQSLFDQFKRLETTWQDDSARAVDHVYRRVNDIWIRTNEMPLATLNDPQDQVPEYGQEEFSELRALYPELSMLTDGSLYGWFDVYQMDCCYINGWSANRDDSFLNYLIGKLADKRLDGEQAKELGQMVAFSLLRGDSLDVAMQFGRDWKAYADAIGSLSYRVAQAMRYVREDRKATDLRGRPITTMMDNFRMGRKFCLTPMTATQNVSDIAGINGIPNS